MNPDDFKDYYAALGLQLGATDDAIKSAFLALTIEHHPHESGFDNTAVLRAAREAYENLTDTDFRRAYDRDYWRMKLQTDPPDQRGPGGRLVGFSRTEQYEEEMRQRARRASPPPQKPLKNPGDPGWKYLTSPAYKEWQRLSDEYYDRHPECSPPDESEPPSPGPGGMQHGLTVNMSHPCVLQTCTYQSGLWKVQSGGPDHCVFCVKAYAGCSRCPVCQALACQKCLKKIAVFEQNSLILGYKVEYPASEDEGDGGAQVTDGNVLDEAGDIGCFDAMLADTRTIPQEETRA